VPPTADKPMLDELDSLVKLLDKNPGLYALGKETTQLAADQLYCPKCGDYRRVYVSVLNVPTWPRPIPGQLKTTPTGGRKYMPGLGIYQCVQCSALFTWVIYHSPGGPALAVLPSTYAGITSPNTPKAVSYYLDQAHRSHAVGANSAAVAMYRAALEQLLYEQGYRSGMLHGKITALEAAVSQGTAQKWAEDMDTDLLRIMKDLGNGAIHPNAGDISKQDAFDAQLVRDVTALFGYLLYTVYEVPIRTAALKAGLKGKASIVNP
jgi:hypothetical protein